MTQPPLHICLKIRSLIVIDGRVKFTQSIKKCWLLSEIEENISNIEKCRIYSGFTKNKLSIYL